MAKKNVYSTTGNGRSYVYGNTARATEAPVLPERRKKKEAEVIREARKKVEARVQEKKALAVNFRPAQVVILAVSAAAVILVAAFYIHELSGYFSSKNQIAAAEKQINVLEEENALLENTREGELDLESVFEFATARGMQVPGKQQVITYKRTGLEYVTKDGEIPND